MKKTYTGMLHLLRSGNVDLERFNEGEKTLEELFEEWVKKEVDLVRVRGKNGEPDHIGRAALQVAAVITVPFIRRQYLEWKRVLRSGAVIEKERDWTFTETARRGAYPHREARRGMLQELRLDSKLIRRATIDYGEPRTVPKPYPSTVYRGLITYPMLIYLRYYFPERPWQGEEFVAHDTSKDVYIREYPFPLIRGSL